MKVLFARDDADFASRADNTLEVVVIPVRAQSELVRLERAASVFPRAAIVAATSRDLVLDAARAGAHAHVLEGAPDEEVEAAIALARARRAAGDARVARRDRTMSAFAHEVRNPLNVITMTAAFLGDGIDPAADRRAVHFEKIERAVDRISALLRDVADAAHLESGELVPSTEPVRATELVAAAIEGARRAADSRNVRLVASGDDATIEVDRARVGRALTAVVEAVTFAARAGSEVRVETRADERSVTFAAACASGGPAPPSRPMAHTLELDFAAGIIAAHGGHAWVETGVPFPRSLAFRLPRS